MLFGKSDFLYYPPAEGEEKSLFNSVYKSIKAEYLPPANAGSGLLLQTLSDRNRRFPAIQVAEEAGALFSSMASLSHIKQLSNNATAILAGHHIMRF